jgi:hypothetical protein
MSRTVQYSTVQYSTVQYSTVQYSTVKLDRSDSVCKIWDFHGGDYEEYRLLGCYAVSPL